MAEVIKTTFQLRRGSAEVWEKNNPILAYGEPGFDKDNCGLKVGDGSTPWNELNFLGVSKEDIKKIVEEYFEKNPGTGTEGTPGKDGVSATHEWNGTVLTITSASGTSSADLVGPEGPQGPAGQDGENGQNGSKGDKGDTGEQGPAGRGIVSVLRTSGTGAPGTTDIYTITYTDDTTSIFTVYNGANGADGENGIGADGFSPIATVTEINDGAIIAITDKSGTTTATIKNGKDGEDGAQGEKGDKGDKGEDGTGVTILGSFSTEEELKQTHPTGEVGQSYLVAGSLYVWSATENDWANVGNIQGPKGDKGDPGEIGAVGPMGPTGKDGTPGKTAYEYAKDAGYTKTESDFASKLAEENYTKEEVDNLIASSIATADHLQRIVIDNSLNIDVNAEGAENFIYMVPKSEELSEDHYDEFMVINGKIEKVGDWAIDLTDYAQKDEIPSKTSELINDSNFIDETKISEAINDALAQAKESGEFDGADGQDGSPGANGITPHVGSNGNWFIGDNDTGIPATGPAGDQGLPGTPGEDGKDGISATHSWNGTILSVTSASGTSSADLKGERGKAGDNGERGTGILKVTTAPTSYTTGTDDYTPKYRIALSTVKSQAKVDKVLVGDTIQYSYYHYHVDYLDSDYAYISKTRVSIRGAAGADGADYVITDEDKTEIAETVKAEVPLVKTAEQPTFVNSVEECTDQSKVYVLPDGNLWAYFRITTIQAPENILPSLAPLSGLVNDGTGYYDGYYATTSSPYYSVDENCTITGIIPCTKADRPVIYIKGVYWDASSSHSRVLIMKNNNTQGQETKKLSESTFAEWFSLTELDTNYYKLEILDGAFAFENSSAGYVSGIVLSFDNTSGAGLKLAHEPIEEKEVTSHQWTNTGFAYQPADYEGRIINLEERATSLEQRVDGLLVNGDGIYTYIAEEAKRVSDAVNEKRTVGSVVFTAMSDAHVMVDAEESWLKPNLTSCRDAGYGLAELRKHMRLDFAAMLGDYTYTPSNNTVAQSKKDFRYFRNCMSDGTNGILSMWLTGNHDINYGANSDRRMTEDELHAYVGSNNVGTVQDPENIGRNYGYIDFENQKIRCIYLNSVDALDYPDNVGTADDALEITAVQTQWLVDVGLNVQSGWQIVILTHQSLNLYPHVMTVLEAYKDSASGNVNVTTNGVTTAVTYDFTAGNRGEVIANIHGHNHNFTAMKISSSGAVTPWLWRVCVPNMDVTRNNEAATSTDTDWAAKFGEFDENGNPVYYNKTQGTAKSTSFCVFVIDRKNRKVHAIHYGAGIDREISY